MHRITVVTTRGSAEAPCITLSSARASPDVTIRRMPSSSPVPGLEVASDDSSREEPGNANSSDQPKRPAKVSNWRKRGASFRHSQAPDPALLSLDLSVVKRRDLPIKLVVDDPMPVGKYYGDPYADDPYADTTTGHFFNLGKNKGSSRDVAAPSPVSMCDKKVESDGDSEVHDEGTKTESWLVPFEQASKCSNPEDSEIQDEGTKKTESWLVPFEQASKCSNPEDSEVHDEGTKTESWLVPFEQASKCSNQEDSNHSLEASCEKIEESDSTPSDRETIPRSEHISGKESEGTEHVKDSLDDKTATDIIRCNGPVVRMEFQGEMVSVSEQTASKLQEGECAWV